MAAFDTERRIPRPQVPSRCRIVAQRRRREAQERAAGIAPERAKRYAEVFVLTILARELGPLVNFGAAALGGILGVLAPRVREDVRATVLHAMGIAAGLIGLSMALSHPDFPIMIVSLAIGGAIGQIMRIEERLEAFAQRLKRRVGGGGQFVEGFMLASLVWTVGAMAVLGAIQSGLTGQGTILYAKSLLDFTSGIFFAAALGIGVAFAAVPLVLYEGLIALLAAWLSPLLGHAVIAPLTYVGGALIVLIGTNMLGATRVRVANLLPAVFLAMLCGGLLAHFRITL